MNGLMRAHPMLIREICDYLEIYDLGRLKKVCKFLNKFMEREDCYDLVCVGRLFNTNFHRDICNFINDSLRNSKGQNIVIHKQIREWNPEFGKAYVYSFIHFKYLVRNEKKRVRKHIRFSVKHDPIIICGTRID